MGRLTWKQVLLGLLVIGVGIAIVRIGDWDNGGPVATLVVNAPANVSAAADRDGSSGGQQIEIERLIERSPAKSASHLFEAHRWTEPVHKKPVVVEAPPPQAPPIPFNYLGKWTERNQMVVILGKDAQTYFVRAGVVLEDVWRVDRIELSYLTMTYLPLGQQQRLAFDKTAPRNETMAQSVNPEVADAVLRAAVPTQATPAEEFSIMLTLDPRAAAVVEGGRVDVVYDPKVLNAVAVGGRLIPSGRADPGRVSVELGGGYIGHSGGATMVRMRVVAESATATEIRFVNFAASDAEKKAVAVAVDGPNPFKLAIEQSGKSKRTAVQ
jgi:hypothetical protein